MVFNGTRCTHDYRQEYVSREGLTTKLKFSFGILSSTISFIDETTFQYRYTNPCYKVKQQTCKKEINQAALRL